MIVGGIVLCGGRSSRMGRPKAWLPIAGELMLPRVVRILRDAVDPVVAVAAQGQDLPALPTGVEVVRDDVQNSGPLAGLAAGLARLVGHANAAYLSACDMPFLKPQFVRWMVDRLGDSTICVPLVGGYHHHLAAVYRVDVLHKVRELLADDCRRLGSLFEKVPTRFVGSAELEQVDPKLDSLRNLNSPEEYEAARSELG